MKGEKIHTPGVISLELKMRADQKVIRKNVLENERINVGSYQIMGEKKRKGREEGKNMKSSMTETFLVSRL